MIASDSRSRAGRGFYDWHYFALAALIVFEAFLFFSHIATQIAPFYPRNFDQANYINESYHLAYLIREHGFGVIRQRYVQPDSATGVSFVVQGGLMAFIAGYHRVALYGLNMAYFAALQIVLFLTVFKRTGSRAFAWLALAFLLALGTLFNDTGGIFDYRIDFSALCLYGIWTCLLAWYRTGWVAKGFFPITAIGVLLVSLRIFTVIYIGLVLCCLLAFYALKARRAATSYQRVAAAYRAWNIFIAGALTAAIVLPLLYRDRQAIYNYYVVGHLVGDEKYIRATEVGVISFWSHLAYYPHSIVSNHIGGGDWHLMLLAVAMAFLSAPWFAPGSIAGFAGRLRHFGAEFLMLGLAVLVPLVLLTIDIAKSPVVGGIVVVPIILMVVFFLFALWRDQLFWVFALLRYSLTKTWSRRVARLQALLPIPIWSVARLGIFLAALWAFFLGATANSTNASLGDLQRISALNNAIVRYAADNDIAVLPISIDRVADYISLGTMAIPAYEKLQRFIDFVVLFGQNDYGIFATPKDVAMKLLERSDVIVLTDPVRGREAPYPMNTKIREYWADMDAWTTQNRVLIYATEIYGIPHRVYARPIAGISGVDDGWITSTGLTVEADSAVLRRMPYILLRGEADYAALGGEPSPTASLAASPSGANVNLPAALRRDGSRYEIVIDARGAATQAMGPVVIRLTFDRHFVPAQSGGGGDQHELVLHAPATHFLSVTPNE